MIDPFCQLSYRTFSHVLLTQVRVYLLDSLWHSSVTYHCRRSLFFSEVCLLARLIIVMPASNAVSERSFSAMRHLKTYLRSTMRQSRLSHLLLPNLNQEKVDQLTIDAIGDKFIRGSEHCLRQFGKFTCTCLYIATYGCTALAFCATDYLQWRI